MSAQVSLYRKVVIPPSRTITMRCESNFGRMSLFIVPEKISFDVAFHFHAFSVKYDLLFISPCRCMEHSTKWKFLQRLIYGGPLYVNRTKSECYSNYKSYVTLFCVSVIAVDNKSLLCWRYTITNSQLEQCLTWYMPIAHTHFIHQYVSD